MKDAKLKNLDITYGELIGKTILYRFFMSKTLFEAKVIGYSPSWKYCKIQFENGRTDILEVTVDDQFKTSDADFKTEDKNGLYIVEVFDKYITEPTVLKNKKDDLKYRLLDKYLETRITVKTWETKECIDFESEDKLYSRYDLMHYIMRIFCNYTEGQLSEIEEHYNKTGEIKYDPD